MSLSQPQLGFTVNGTAAGRTLELARAMRRGEASPSPYQLFALAREEAGARPGRRGRTGELYRHALTEAGFLIDAAAGAPFAVCPHCGYTLTEGDPA